MEGCHFVYCCLKAVMDHWTFFSCRKSVWKGKNPHTQNIFVLDQKKCFQTRNFNTCAATQNLKTPVLSKLHESFYSPASHRNDHQMQETIGKIQNRVKKANSKNGEPRTTFISFLNRRVRFSMARCGTIYAKFHFGPLAGRYTGKTHETTHAFQLCFESNKAKIKRKSQTPKIVFVSLDLIINFKLANRKISIIICVILVD